MKKRLKMKGIKKPLSFALVLTMTLALGAGCTQKTDSGDTTSATVAPATETAAAETPTPTLSSGSAVTNTDNKTSSDYTVFSYSDGIDSEGYFEGVKALDYVELFDYKAFSIPSDVHTVKESSVQAEIDNLLSYFSSAEQIDDRAIVDGDTVNIDYVGSVDGVEFEGGSTQGSGTNVTIGVTNYIDDFLAQLIGHVPGETINVEVTFPEDYSEVSLQGKDALFVTTINYIEETVIPELTDDFVIENLASYYGWETIEQMKDEMYAELKKAAIQQYINEYLCTEVVIKSIPDSIMEYQGNAMVKYYQYYAEYYGMDLLDFIGLYMGVASVEELIALNVETNVQNANYTLVSQAVAEELGLTVTEEDMTAYFGDYSQYIEGYGLPYLKQVVLFQKVLDYITANAVME